MKLLRRVFVLVLVLLMMFVFAACQSDTDTASDSGEEEAAAETASESDAEEETEAPVADEEMEEKPTYRIGYIQASSDAYYQMQADAAQMVVDYINENEDFGVEMTVALSEGQAEKELAN